MTPHWTDIVVFHGVEVHVSRQEGVVPILFMILSVEHVVLDIRRDAFSNHMCIVLLAPISGVGTDLLTLLAEP